MKSPVSLVLLFFVTQTLLSPVWAGHRLVANEGRKLCIFDSEGTLEWSMELKNAPHDMHWMPDGKLLTHQGTEIVLVDVEKKEIVWSFDAQRLIDKAGVEVHSVWPLPEDRVGLALSGAGKIYEIDRNGKVLHSIKMVLNHPNPHRDTRLVRRLDDGNYLVAHEGDGVVREYDRDGKVVWQFPVPMFGKSSAAGHGPEAFGNAVFSAIRLNNGNTLIGTGNGHSVLEVAPDKKIIWKLDQKDLDGVTLGWVTTLEVHPNGHIVIGNCHAGPDNPQLIEIDREKNIHWKLHDWEHLGNNVSNSQILDVEDPIR